MALGLRARLIRNRQHLHLADGAGGAALVACVALGVVWVFGAVALHAPGTAHLRGDVQRSLIMRSLNELMPPSGPVLNALDRVDPAPSIVGPATPVAPPDARIAGDPDVQRRRALGDPGARHRLRARRRGLGLGRRPRPGRHQRPRRRRRGRHHGDDRRRRVLRRHRRSTTTPTTTSPSCASRPTCRRSRRRRAAEPRPARRRPRLPRQRPLRRRARPASAKPAT